jgi:hypothetical protein
MSESLVFRLGSDVHCADGDCGQIKSVVISPGDDSVTHLVVEPAHEQGLAKLVPLRLVDTTVAPAPGGEVRLRCSVAEYGQLDAAEATYSSPAVEGDSTYQTDPMVSWPSYAPPGAMGMPGVMGMPAMPGDGAREVEETVTVDTVQAQLPGADEVSPGEHAHANDGDIGHVQGIVVDPDTGHVTAVLLREWHLLSHRTVLIPRSAVAEVGADGFHLSISKRQVRDLPSADVDHPTS